MWYINRALASYSKAIYNFPFSLHLKFQSSVPLSICWCFSHHQSVIASTSEGKHLSDYKIYDFLYDSDDSVIHDSSASNSDTNCVIDCVVANSVRTNEELENKDIGLGQAGQTYKHYYLQLDRHRHLCRARAVQVLTDSDPQNGAANVVNQHFRGTYCLHHQAVCTSEI